jgi:hypothetical protein
MHTLKQDAQNHKHIKKIKQVVSNLFHRPILLILNINYSNNNDSNSNNGNKSRVNFNSKPALIRQ